MLSALGSNDPTDQTHPGELQVDCESVYIAQDVMGLDGRLLPENLTLVPALFWHSDSDDLRRIVFVGFFTRYEVVASFDGHLAPIFFFVESA